MNLSWYELTKNLHFTIYTSVYMSFEDDKHYHHLGHCGQSATFLCILFASRWLQLQFGRKAASMIIATAASSTSWRDIGHLLSPIPPWIGRLVFLEDEDQHKHQYGDLLGIYGVSIFPLTVRGMFSTEKGQLFSQVDPWHSPRQYCETRAKSCRGCDDLQGERVEGAEDFLEFTTKMEWNWHKS